MQIVLAFFGIVFAAGIAFAVLGGLLDVCSEMGDWVDGRWVKYVDWTKPTACPLCGIPSIDATYTINIVGSV